MDIYNIRDFTFSYPNSNKLAINSLSLDISKGEFVVICGKSGCGKTTFIKSLKSVLAPFGNKKGYIYYKGRNLSEIDERTQTSEIGYVFQNPDNQLVTDKVWHELSFGLESLGVDSRTIRLRVAEMAAFFGIQDWFYRDVSELSGGQKQLLNLASIMVMQPEVVVLDEPTSQLDPIARSEFLTTVLRVNREFGTTVIMTEHRLEEVLDITDRVVVMDKGKIIAEGEPCVVGKYLKDINSPMFLAMPTPMQIYNILGDGGDKCPINIRDGRAWLDKYLCDRRINIDIVAEEVSNNIVLDLKDLWFRYEKKACDVVKGLSLKIKKGEIYAIVGGNGTGKTTTLSLISGINKPYRGEIKIDESMKVGQLSQNPQSLFTSNSVIKDLEDVCKCSDRISEVATLCQIEELFNCHPYDLSGGEQQRVALAKILLINPDILLLDEPTKGLDESFKIELGNILLGLRNREITIIIVSHDIEFCAKYANRCGLFFDGAIVTEDSAKKFFIGNSFYTTLTNRMCRGKIENAVVIDDVINVFGCENNKNDDIFIPPMSRIKELDYQCIEQDIENVSANKRNILSSIIMLLLIPSTIAFGMLVLNDRKYYFISILIVMYSTLPFMMRFENKKPRARELVVISVMCAIAILARTVFFMLPQFKPVIALIIISGICLGGEAGFMVGVVTGFVSNFFFGQGPWTPYQIFCFGIIGFISGVFKKTKLLRNNLSLCIYGGIVTIIIYGGIMNPAAVLMYQDKPTINMVLASYIPGLIYDMIHAMSTIVFLFILAKPMIQKLERIKLKYGMLR